MNSLNIQQRFNAMFLVTMLIASIITILLINQLIATYTKEYTHRQWHDYTKLFAESVLYPVIIGSSTQVELLAKNFSSNSNIVNASVFNQYNELLVHSGETSCVATKRDFASFQQTENKLAWCFYSPLFQDTNYLGYVELTVSKQQYQQTMNRLLTGSIIVIFVTSLTLFIIVKNLSQLFTKTLLNIANTLKKVSLGKRGVRVNCSGGAEIDNIRETLNEMLNSIEQNEHLLELRVCERTQALQIALDRSQTANVYKGQIMSLVSHEMKTPLHAISGYLQLLEEQLAINSDEYSLVQKAFFRAKDLNHLIDNILIYAKLESEKYDLERTSFDIQDVIDLCIENSISLATKNDNRILNEHFNATVYTDKHALIHIINNLLSNACKFTSSGPITLKCEMQNANLVLHVSDTGCGIPKEAQAKIFEAWWQVDMSLSRKFGGHGLGLAITKQFIERLSGEIYVTDNHPKGTIFTVKIPNAIDSTHHQSH